MLYLNDILYRCSSLFQTPAYSFLPATCQLTAKDQYLGMLSPPTIFQEGVARFSISGFNQEMALHSQKQEDSFS